MIDPTDEMIADAMQAYNATGSYGAAVEAVLAIVERDYLAARRRCGNRGFAGASDCWRELGHEGNHLWSRDGRP